MKKSFILGMSFFLSLLLSSVQAQSVMNQGGTFFAEYNPHTWHTSAAGNSHDTNYNGVSVGLKYFFPIAGSFGLEAGLKGQYMFRSKNEAGINTSSNLFSGTIPVSLAFAIPLSSGVSLVPHAGVFGRYNFSSRTKSEINGTGTSVDNFSKKDVPYPLKRFQAGIQVGADFRISEMMTIGGGYWMDLTEIQSHTKLRGFDIRLGTNF